MKIIESSSYTEAKKKKKWDPNPWAVCTDSVGREDKDKYERCVQDVKDQQTESSEEAQIKEAKKKDDWPEKLKKGRFTEWCKRNGFDGPSKACADKAFKSDDASVRGMASFYLNTVKP